MRRRLLVPLLLSVALAPAAHAAAPAPQVADPKGDWPVAAQDIVSARLSSRLVGGKPYLRAEITLAAVPEPNLKPTYIVTFANGPCDGWAFEQSPFATEFRHALCPKNELEHISPATTKFPVTVTVKGSTVTFETPYAGGIRRGLRAESIGVIVGTAPTGVVFADTTSGYHEMIAADVAYGSRPYVVGSDLPRR